MKNQLIFISLFSINLIFAQEKLPDTTFVDKIEFDYVNKKLTIDEIKSRRKDYKLNFNSLNAINSIQFTYNDEIEKTIDVYYKYTWLPKVYALLRYYEPLFENSLNYYKLPLELKYIAIIESNLNPQAGSYVGASGLWQFMPHTGKQYGLVKNNYINLFYDPYTSTDAACRYFNYLYKLFNDWNLVISAYNCGQGKVLKAIKKAGSNDYFKVRPYLPKETRDYIMRFHTVKFYHQMYDLYYDYKFNLPISFDKVKECKVKNKTTFKEYCKKNKLNLSLIYFLNPHIITEQIPKNTFIYIL